MRYTNTLRTYILQRCPEADDLAIDLLERLLTYNPKLRISASDSLRHPWFFTEPRPCEAFQIQKMDEEHHEYMQKEEKKEKTKKERLEKEEREKKETEENERRWGRDSKRDIEHGKDKNAGKNRLSCLIVSNSAQGKGKEEESSLTKRKPEKASIEKGGPLAALISGSGKKTAEKAQPETVAPDSTLMNVTVQPFQPNPSAPAEQQNNAISVCDSADKKDTGEIKEEKQ